MYDMYERSPLEELRRRRHQHVSWQIPSSIDVQKDSTVRLLEDKIKHGHIRTRKDVLEYLGIPEPKPNATPTYDGSA